MSKTLKIAVAFSLAVLLGASMFASDKSFSESNKASKSTLAKIMDRSHLTVGAGPWP